MFDFKGRKRICLLGLVLAAVCFCGCSSGNSQKAAEYKALGISQLAEGEYESAAASFQKALDQSLGKITAEEIDICYYKAEALYLSGDVQGAAEVYEALIAYDKKNYEAYYLLGNLYLEEKETEAALEAFATAADLKSDLSLSAGIFEALYEAGLTEEAEEYLEAAFAFSATEASEYYAIGRLYYLTDNSDNAKVSLLEARNLGAEEANLLLGCIYAAEGSYEEAVAAFAAYREAFPDDVYSLKEMIAVYEAAGDFESAAAAAEAFLALYEDEDVAREYVFLQTRIGE